jgi:succinyl-diaminopimelate desuccinylase
MSAAKGFNKARGKGMREGPIPSRVDIIPQRGTSSHSMSNSMIDPKRASAEVAERKQEWLEILSDLIQIPSENPPGDTQEIADYFCELLEEYGVEYEVIAPQEEMPNIVAQFDGEQGDPEEGNHLVYNGHLDTFPARDESEWDRDPFSGAIEDGKVHGRGAGDMHGGFTATLAAFLYLYENRDRVHGRVTFTAVSDEETGGNWGTKYVVENYPKYRGDAVLNGEPSAPYRIVFGERGKAWYDIRVHGKAAHVTSNEGLSAIDILVDLLPEFRTLPEKDDLLNVPEDFRDQVLAGKEATDRNYWNGATEHSLQLLVNTGVIEGGEKISLIAENARAEVDVRLPVGTDPDDVTQHIENIVSDYPGDISVECYDKKESTYSDVSSPLFQHLQDAVEQIRDADPEFSYSLGGSDGIFFRREGMDVALYGPTAQNIGGPNEYIDVDEFMDVTKAHVEASVQYLNDSR